MTFLKTPKNFTIYSNPEHNVKLQMAMIVISHYIHGIET